jgi:pimeloyl-ACP methyl ester carboxylesterase
MFRKARTGLRLLPLGIALVAGTYATPLWSKDSPDCSAGEDAAKHVSQVSKERFSVEVSGAGPDVILIPGLGTPRAVWNETVATFGGCYRLHSVQLRGFGDAAGINASGPVLQPFVDELAEYIAMIGKSSGKAPMVVGHSMGGLAGLKLAKARPELVSRLMMIDALPNFAALIPGLGAAEASTIERTAAQMRSIIAARYGKEPNPAEIKASVEGMSLNPTFGGTMMQWSQSADQRVVAQIVYEDLVADMRPELPSVSSPVLVLAAWHSGMPFTEMQVQGFFQRQFAGLPSYDVKTVAGSAHFIMLDQPEKFNSELAEFLAKR